MTTLRALTRGSIAAFAGGTLLVGAAWAGVGFAPASPAGDVAATAAGTGGSTAPAHASQAALADAHLLTTRNAGTGSAAASGSGKAVDLSGLRPLRKGEFLVGASVRSLSPD